MECPDTEVLIMYPTYFSRSCVMLDVPTKGYNENEFSFPPVTHTVNENICIKLK